MNDKLILDLKSESENFSSIFLLDEACARELILKVSNIYIEDANKIWWWDSLATECKNLKYKDGDGLELIKEIVPSDPEVLLFVSDDNPSPWPVFKGVLSEVLDLIGEVNFVEYILSDEELNWLIFDTHHNALVVAGDLC